MVQSFFATSDQDIQGGPYYGNSDSTRQKIISSPGLEISPQQHPTRPAQGVKTLITQNRKLHQVSLPGDIIDTWPKRSQMQCISASTFV